jgi:hypothetical protein
VRGKTEIMNRSSGTRWPSYLSGTLDDVTALGVIALNYGELEVAFRLLSAVIGGVGADHVVNFHKTKNPTRMEAIEQAINKSDLPEKLKDYARHFVQCYKRCADNRNDMMHSSIGGSYTDAVRGGSGFVFAIYSKSGERLFCTACLEDLRLIADQIHEITSFGSTVAFFVSQFWRDRKNGTVSQFDERLSLLKEKPSVPAALHWRSLPTP